MFSKGPRFQPQAPSDVPGPNSYNLNQESQLTNYKRGAFLEKAERFRDQLEGEEGEASLPPAPQPTGDRYATLQRRVDDLERIHNEGKKAHRAEVERLKQELARSQKQATLLETRVQDLKKSATTDQAQLRELRVKLKTTETSVDLKKALKEETRGKDRTISELEQSVALEKKRREAAETELSLMRSSMESDRDSFQSQLWTLQLTESTLLTQLEQYQDLLARVATEYAHLDSTSLPKTLHDRLRHENGLLQLRNWRLGRRLANSQDQITELAELIRQKQDENAFLSRQVSDLEDECLFHRQLEPSLTLPEPLLDPLRDSITSIVEEQFHTALSNNRLYQASTSLLADAYRLLSEEAVLGYKLADAELKRGESLSKTLRDEAKQAREALQMEQEAAAQQLVKNAEIENKARAIVERAETMSLGDRRTIQQLTETVRKGRMTEEGLRSEIQSLTSAVAESEQFQAAYYSLSDEVKSLIARKELAEGEAEKLSKFNAEILSHNNPAQKIFYLDRVRRELAETKHKLALADIDLQSAKSENAELVSELETYTAIPMEGKPRTVVTRVTRPPLSMLNRSSRQPEMENFLYTK
ncbi:hypothetical protein MIND_00051600 [Mycena indigotica]|uniref:Uncharacterized protein n=1 Tax=Mycena indigotica TaxID=2126181 RepID=A0A8H6TGK7_9AGAR|nr:uncharacterized protein MIND_00051600 [Mycena indigotica]KAF7315370.1 hypothetical protein MIND_00051600 [Mycena indigotica]